MMQGQGHMSTQLDVVPESHNTRENKIFVSLSAVPR